MNLYLISANTTGYNMYSDAVVAAESSLKARKTHPSGNNENFNDDDPIGNYTWVKWEDVTARKIGTAVKGTKAGVICASFHAG